MASLVFRKRPSEDMNDVETQMVITFDRMDRFWKFKSFEFVPISAITLIWNLSNPTYFENHLASMYWGEKLETPENGNLVQ